MAKNWWVGNNGRVGPVSAQVMAAAPLTRPGPLMWGGQGLVERRFYRGGTRIRLGLHFLWKREL